MLQMPDKFDYFTLADSSVPGATHAQENIDLGTLTTGNRYTTQGFFSIVFPQSQDESEEVEWDNIVKTPHVHRGLLHLAAEARRQIAAGETEEGGFAVE